MRRAKSDGFQVSCEVTPHHLVLTESAVEGFNTDAKMSPPLRGEEDVQALIEGLADGTIDAIASDHAPHELDSKQKEFAEAAMGILGLQTSLPLVLELVEAGKISRRRAIEAMSAKPAEVFGLEGGSLATGAVADVVIVDPKRKWVFDSEVNASLSNNSPFLGRQLCGAADTVLVGGSVVVSKGEVLS